MTSAAIENLRKVEAGTDVDRLGFSKTNQSGVQRNDGYVIVIACALR